MGYPKGEFVQHLNMRMKVTQEMSVADEGVGELIAKLLKDMNHWDGTATDLFHELRLKDPEGNFKSSLPKDPREMDLALRSCIAGLMAVGIRVSFT
ncbi:MAG: hypothetical protein ACREBQ_06315, partial [Nitrososphaerales archaeon]